MASFALWKLFVIFVVAAFRGVFQIVLLCNGLNVILHFSDDT